MMFQKWTMNKYSFGGLCKGGAIQRHVNLPFSLGIYIFHHYSLSLPLCFIFRPLFQPIHFLFNTIDTPVQTVHFYLNTHQFTQLNQHASSIQQVSLPPFHSSSYFSLQSDNSRVEWMQQKCERLYYKKDYSKAIDLISQAVDLETTNRNDMDILGELWKLKAECYRDLDRYIYGCYDDIVEV